MSPEEVLSHLQDAVKGVSYVSHGSIDCDASEFWEAILEALRKMVTTTTPPRGGKGGIHIGDTWYFSATDGKGCPNCGAIGTGGHGGGCNKTESYDERGVVIPCTTTS